MASFDFAARALGGREHSLRSSVPALVGEPEALVLRETVPADAAAFLRGTTLLRRVQCSGPLGHSPSPCSNTHAQSAACDWRIRPGRFPRGAKAFPRWSCSIPLTCSAPTSARCTRSRGNGCISYVASAPSYWESDIPRLRAGDSSGTRACARALGARAATGA
jgi:hypothetical protein